MISYLRGNLIRGFKTSPAPMPLSVWMTVPIYMCFALVVGFATGLLSVGFIGFPMAGILPFTLLVFPSLLEEAFFRGVLIPNDAIKGGTKGIIFHVALSTALFVLWHPLNALIVNKAAIPVFLNPAFLVITAVLGMTCGLTYIMSRSLWVPTIIHWLTVVVWVIFLGGRNMILDL